MSRKTLSNVLAIHGLTGALLYSFGGSFLWGKNLTVEVIRLRSENGLVYMTIYDEANAFEQNSVTNYITYAAKRVEEGAARFSFNRLYSGPYAISVFHDENSNERFDMVDSQPIEGWGYSNNVGQTENPKFEAAAIEIRDSNTKFIIQMNYLN
jgi:uncharacterized protein (DUF2141 family)